MLIPRCWHVLCFPAPLYNPLESARPIAQTEQEVIMRSIPASQQGLTLRDFRKMEYLSQVIDETLRLVNISFVSFRQATNDVFSERGELGSGNNSSNIQQ